MDNETHKRMEDFLFAHEYLFRQQTARYYPLSLELIEKYADRWDFLMLSFNPVIPLTDAFLEKYADRIHWQVLKQNNIHWDKVSARFLEKMAAFPEKTTWSSYPFPDQVKPFIWWRWSHESLPEPLKRVLESPISQLNEDFFAQFEEYWDWQHLSSCIHLRWTTSFYERFYKLLDQRIVHNPAFYENVFQQVLNDEIIDQVMTWLSPEGAVNFYSLESKNDEFGMLPHVRYSIPGESSYNAYQPYNQQWTARFSSPDLDLPIPEVRFELSWFLRYPIRFADYHQWPFENHYPAIVVSEKLKNILERFDLPPHRFYKIDLAIPDNAFGAESRIYYIFYLPEQEYLYFDYDRLKMVEDEDRVFNPDRGPSYHRPYYNSSYFTRKTAAVYPETISSPEKFLEAKAELKTRAPKKELRPQEYIWNAGFDLISCGAENPRHRIWLSEDVKKAIEASGATGIRFERVWECRPRMSEVETLEHRLKNERILESLRTEFQHRVPEPEQMAVRNFRASAIWAEEVCRNKGIVQKIFAENPAIYATDDAFLQTIRQKELELDVIFPDWFIRILRKKALPPELERFTLQPLESITCYQLDHDFPVSVKSVVFAEYSSTVLFLVLKSGSFYELDDVIYEKQFDQGPPPSIVLRLNNEAGNC